ncbi:MAG: SGNH/GDSL hydrolase family protein [Candidatus Nanopelagicales bacterium]
MIPRPSLRSAALGSGGMAGAAAASLGVLVAQARLARRAIGPQRGVPPYQDGRFGPTTGTSLRLALLGDSVAAGLGAQTAADTVAGALVRGVAASSRRPVSMINHAVVGARSADLERQVTRCLSARPHVAVIIIGANDVTHLVPHHLAAQRLALAIDRLSAVGTVVVVGPCPDLGTVRPVGPPLRWVARELSRSLAAVQRRAAARSGARVVHLYDLLGPEFEVHAEAMFGPDLFHPSALGYRRIGAHLLPPVLDALGLPSARPRLELAAPVPRVGGPDLPPGLAT